MLVSPIHLNSYFEQYSNPSLKHCSMTVVWNPWEKKSKAITDFGDEEYKQMLCVDGAAIEKPITLKPAEQWTGRLELSVMPSIQ